MPQLGSRAAERFTQQERLHVGTGDSLADMASGGTIVRAVFVLAAAALAAFPGALAHGYLMVSPCDLQPLTLQISAMNPINADVPPALTSPHFHFAAGAEGTQLVGSRAAAEEFPLGAGLLHTHVAEQVRASAAVTASASV